MTEIQQLENLFKGTGKSAADRPDLARRPAETYAELEGAAFREKTEAEISATASRRRTRRRRASSKLSPTARRTS
ncbi:MAG: hypothetical protein U0235_21035 [Polyangiaceae bacterium]